MATLDNAVWLGGSGFAENGVTTLTEGGFSTYVTGTFTANAWDATAGGTGVSDFGAAFVTSAINADYQFSNPVENLSFDIEHLNDDGASTFDDQWTISALDENGDPIPAADIIAGLSGLTDEIVIDNGDGTVTIEAAGGIANNVTVDLPGPVSSLSVVYEPGPNGTQTGGSGISDFTFDIPEPDTDGDGVLDSVDLDTDGDGILDTEEGYSVTPPSSITVTMNGDFYATLDNTRWELRDSGGNVVQSGASSGTGEDTWTFAAPANGDYTFVVLDDFGDGLSVADGDDGIANYTVTVDGTEIINSGDLPNFGDEFSHDVTLADIITTRDTDGDGIADHLDLDSDNDGITDNVEAQSTDGYVAPTGTDTDGDGLDDAYDATPTTGAAGSGGLAPVDTDGDGTDDYIDTDSDNDGTNDVDEAGHGITQAVIDASGDSDFDGIMDAVDDVVGWDVNDNDVDGAGDFTLADTDGDTAADGSGANPMVNDLDFRDAATADYIVEGTAGDDTIDGSYTSDPDGDRVENGDGNPLNPGTAGGDNDSITAGAGNDSVAAGSGNDTIRGEAGNDTISGGAGGDVIDGGLGDDLVDYTTSDAAVTVDLSTNSAAGGHATGDILIGIDGVIGSAFNDSLVGGTGSDTLIGGAGDDTIHVAQGDVVSGGDGDDYFTLEDLGEAGTDAITITGGDEGGADNDTLQLTPDITLADITFTPSSDTGAFAGSFTMADGTLVTFDEIENIICFTPGTMILTERGHRPIESLKPGDMVITRDHGAQPLRWVGTSSVSGRGKFAPVRVAADVIGARRSVLVSPQHRVLFEGYECELLFGTDEVLAAATHLEDGYSVVRAPCPLVTYIHLMFDQHQIIYAEGAPTESFFAGDVGLASISGFAREDMFKAFPALRSDITAYGDTARVCLKAHEARLLMSEYQSLPMVA